jgi:hypothetical protein
MVILSSSVEGFFGLAFRDFVTARFAAVAARFAHRLGFRFPAAGDGVLVAMRLGGGCRGGQDHHGKDAKDQQDALGHKGLKTLLHDFVTGGIAGRRHECRRGTPGGARYKVSLCGFEASTLFRRLQKPGKIKM